MEYIRLILSKNLLQLRKASGETQSSLALKLETTPATYNRWENGTSWPDANSLEKLALIYGIRSSRFFHDIDLNLEDMGKTYSPPPDLKDIIETLESLLVKIKN